MASQRWEEVSPTENVFILPTLILLVITPYAWGRKGCMFFYWARNCQPSLRFYSKPYTTLDLVNPSLNQIGTIFGDGRWLMEIDRVKEEEECHDTCVDTACWSDWTCNWSPNAMWMLLSFASSFYFLDSSSRLYRVFKWWENRKSKENFGKILNLVKLYIYVKLRPAKF